MRKIRRPVIAVAITMLAMILASPELESRPTGLRRDFFNYRLDPYLATYWSVYSLVLLYQLWFVMRMLYVLRRDPRSRITAHLYIVAGWLGVGGVLCLDAHLLMPGLVMTPLAWAAVSLPAALMVAAAAYSWIRRERHEEFPKERDVAGG